jgi:hypothetical protein
MSNVKILIDFLDQTQPGLVSAIDGVRKIEMALLNCWEELTVDLYGNLR